MKRRAAICLSVSVLLAPAEAFAAQPERPPEAPFALVRDGRPVARLLVASRDELVAAAVADLVTYVERSSGAKLEVAEGTQDLPGPTLHVGETELFSRIEEVRTAIRVDGFCLALFGEDLLVAGNLTQGTANGIWTILQDEFGMRWYSPGELWEVIPSSSTLEIAVSPLGGTKARVENPSFAGRHYWGGGAESSFGRRLRLTQPGTPLPYVGAGHSLEQVVPLEKFADDHPDYFAWIDGRHVTDRVTHPCFTHPDMSDVFLEYIRAGGGSLGVNDNLDACRCVRCLAADGASRRYMGMWSCSESYFRLVAEVARRTKSQLPGRRLGVFAYQLVNSPPLTVEHIGTNVDVVLCQDTSQHFDGEVQRTDMRMSREWVRKAGGVSLYDYYGINFWTPRYFPSLLAAQLRHCARAGILGYVTHSTTMIDSAMPMFYLYSRLLWDAELDPQATILAMLDDLYGEAVGPVREFYAHWERCWLRQERGRWFKGMDDFRGEMTIYALDDIERGHSLLREAEALAKNPRVRDRVRFLLERYAFTLVAARLHEVTMRAVSARPPETPSEAREASDGVVSAWRTFATELARAEKLPETSATEWHSKTFRVRAWALKQQVRDAVLAPLVRWAISQEDEWDPAALSAAEGKLAEVALSNRNAVEPLVTESVSALPRSPRADPLRVALCPRLAAPVPLEAGEDDWGGIDLVDELPWVFRMRPPDLQIGKYDEPMPQCVVDPPDPTDCSAEWQAAWDDRALFLRIAVRDDRHLQTQRPETAAREDSLQVFLTPRRAEFDYPEHSWYFLMGGLREDDAHLVVALRDGETLLHVAKAPSVQEPSGVGELVRVRAARRGRRTIYEAALDWRLLPGFLPAAGRSIGIALLVTDADGGNPRTAEYGGGVLPRKRPTEFAGLRLVDGRARR